MFVIVVSQGNKATMAIVKVNNGINRITIAFTAKLIYQPASLRV